MPDKKPHTPESNNDKVSIVPKSVQWTMLLAIIGGLFFIKPFWGTILFSALIAFIFNPVYKSVLRRTRKSGLAVLATIFVAMLSVILPMLIVVGVTVSQANTLVHNVQKDNVNLGPAEVEKTVEKGTDRINNTIKALPGGDKLKIDKEKLSDNLKKVASEFAHGLVNFIKSAGGAFFGLISTFILAFFLIVAMLTKQSELIKFIKELSPFHEKITGLYLDRVGAMTKAMVKGQLIIAVAQGFASAFSLWIVGVDYFWFFFVLLTFLSFIPLGGGILTIPIGIIIMLTGNIPRGLFVLLWHFIVVSNIDNILRPQLVPKHVRLNSALILLSVFSGLTVFGAAGVIYGPVVMILLITTFEMYSDYVRTLPKTAPPAGK